MSDNFVFVNESMDDEGEDNEGSFRSSSFCDPTEEDYYASLNLPRNASPEEIVNQYRKLSRIYHPDKHHDPASKVKADLLFAKIKTAYEVLMDPEKRAVYDTLGAHGLKDAERSGPNNMQLVTKWKTPTEIREEFERLQREREEKDLEKLANPKGTMVINVNASEIFSVYDTDSEDDYYDDVGPYIELTGFHFAQSVEAPVTKYNVLQLSGSVTADNGRGKGNVDIGWRKILNDRSWITTTVGGSTNGVNFGLKGGTVFKNTYMADFNASFQSTPEGLRPLVNLGIGRNFDALSNGSITWRPGLMGGLTTQYIWHSHASTTRYVASCHLGVQNSSLTFHANHVLEEKKVKVKGGFKLGLLGFAIEYGLEKKLSPITTVGASVIVGNLTGVYLRLRLSRSHQSYQVPIHLCDQILPAPIVYGSLTPLVLWVVVNKLIIEPREREAAQKEKAKLRAQHKTRLAEMKAEAESAIALMQVTYNRIIEEEQRRNGLIISSAKYGLITPDDSHEDETVDVTVALQCLVKDSKLILYDTSKSQLPGFYDPLPGEEKTLEIHYIFHAKPHYVLLKDHEPLTIPRPAHLQEPS